MSTKEFNLKKFTFLTCFLRLNKNSYCQPTNIVLFWRLPSSLYFLNCLYVYIIHLLSNMYWINTAKRMLCSVFWVKLGVYCTVCPRSSDPLYIETCYIQWVTTSCTYSMPEKSFHFYIPAHYVKTDKTSWIFRMSQFTA